MKHIYRTIHLNDANQQLRRRKYLTATLVTCLAVAMLGGAVHVVTLGANRMADMRASASYNISEVKDRIRAAGEDVILQRTDVEQQSFVSYSVDEVRALLTDQQWQELSAQVLIPGGEFWLGTDRVRSDDQNKPRHRVNLKSFYIDKYPVTNAQYALFTAETGYRYPLHWESGRIPDGLLLHPVTMISWYDANKYAKWAGKRLVTESEWEKAARGDKGYRWPWGNTMDTEKLNTYYSVGSTTEVTKYSGGASIYGVMDMSGNVSEWTSDDFIPYPGSSASDQLFVGKVGVAGSAEDRALKVVDMVPVAGRYKVLRGGSWKSDPFSTATYHRNFSWPHYASDFFGFRCASDQEITAGAHDEL